MGDRRRFGTSERVALFLAAGGKCSICDAVLEPGWHADHVMPYSAGGETDVLNGQALCPRCNERKGNDQMQDDARAFDARRWQREAARDYRARAQQDYLCVATPGAGKTHFALQIASVLIADGVVRRVIVVCPTVTLKTQWEQNAANLGLELDAGFANSQGRPASDFSGAIVTYQQVASAPQIQRALTREPSLVIFDEIHHAGDERSWGTALREAYEGAARRLSLSGTPFRSDNCSIPFVRYDKGRSQADFSYNYEAALSDGICSPVFFPSYEGIITWTDGFDEVTATFADELSEQRDGQRLNTALDPHGQWLPDVIRQAHQQLQQLRDVPMRIPAESGPPLLAGGLVIVRDQYHAKAVVEIVKRITGRQPVLAISDERDSMHRIKAFERSDDPWIVAVKMVSEGVDIPRLKVGVYATNVMTELYFRQAVGRVVRGDYNSYFYIPAAAKLKLYAQRIKQERDHQLREAIENEERMINGVGERQPRFFMPIGSEAIADAVIFDHSEFGQAELQNADQVKARAGLDRIPTAAVAKILRAANVVPPIASVPAGPSAISESITPLREQKRRLRKICSRLVGRINAITGADYQSINAQLNEATHVRCIDDATLDKLRERVALAQEWLDHDAK